MIVEVEECTLPMAELEPTLVKTLEGMGFTSITSSDNTDSSFDVVIVMAEGYVIARRWPKQKYVGLDIHLWGRFEKLEDTRAALVKALGSGNDIKKGSVSSFRVVASGMYGNDSWEEDVKLIGPDLTKHTRKCNDTYLDAADAAAAEESEESKIRDPFAQSGAILKTDEEVDAAVEGIMTPEFVKTVMDAVVDNMAIEGSAVVVFCNMEGMPCLTSSALEQNDKIGPVITLHACPDIAEMAFVGKETQLGLRDERIEVLYACRTKLEAQIKKVVNETGIAIDGAVLDGEAPYGMARVYTSFWTNRRNLFQPSVLHYYVALTPNSWKDWWRTVVLNEVHRIFEVDPLHRSMTAIRKKSVSRQDPGFHLNMLNVDMPDSFPRIRAVEKAILANHGDELVAYPIVLEGGGLEYHDKERFQPIEFRQSDYDLSAEIEQYEKQQAVGRQTIFQFARDKDHRDSSPNIDSILKMVLNSMDVTVTSTKTYRELGDGMVEVVRCKEGNIVAVWDGRDHIVVNVFRFEQSRKLADEFLTRFLTVSGRGWKKELRDDMPRGYNRVVNFATQHK